MHQGVNRLRKKSRREQEDHPSAAKAGLILQFAARLKSCPFKESSFSASCKSECCFFETEGLWFPTLESQNDPRIDGIRKKASAKIE
jgi:hypothetical protein